MPQRPSVSAADMGLLLGRWCRWGVRRWRWRSCGHRRVDPVLAVFAVLTVTPVLAVDSVLAVRAIGAVFATTLRGLEIARRRQPRLTLKAAGTHRPFGSGGATGTRRGN